MLRRISVFLLPSILLLSITPPALPCSLCAGSFSRTPTLREESGQTQARLVLYGTLQKPRLNADGTGATELQIGEILKKDKALGERRIIELPRYLPVSDPKNPPRFLVFCDVEDGKIDVYRGVPLQTASSYEYVRKALALDARDRVANLIFYFDYLENSDKEVAADAFLEFAKASDQDINHAAAKLSADKLRRWLKDAQTPPERLSLYAVLLGACGTAADAELLKGMLKENSDRIVNAYDGLLGGYIHLKPAEGWELAQATLSDSKRPLPIRLALVRTLRYYQGAQPKESRPMLLKSYGAMIAQGELADVAIEDLRRYQIWDLTKDILLVYGKKGYDAPLMQRSILRYAALHQTRRCREKIPRRRNARRSRDCQGSARVVAVRKEVMSVIVTSSSPDPWSG